MRACVGVERQACSAFVLPGGRVTPGVDATATTALVRAIHKVDDVGSELDDLDVPSHVTVASSQQQVVPLAILLARMPRGTPTSTAVARIAAEPVLRKLVEGGKGE